MIIYLSIMNIVGFLTMGIDKYKAKHHCWRIPENSLMLISLIGGSIGAYIGMYLFKHKTKKLKFSLGIPVIIFMQILLASYLLLRQ